MSRRFKTKCPCCQKTILVDAERRQVIALGDATGEDSFEAALDELSEQEQKRKTRFDKALEDEARKDKPSFDDFL